MNNIFEIRGIDFCEISQIKACFELEQNSPHHCYDVGQHSLKSAAIAKSENADDTILAAMMLHDIGKLSTKTTDENGVDHFYNHSKFSVRVAKSLLNRLNIFSEKEQKDIVFLIKYHMFNFNESNIDNFKKNCPKSLLQKLAKVKRYDVLAQSEYMRSEKIAQIEQFEKLIED